MANVGGDFSLRDVLLPLPLTALPVAWGVLSLVPLSLAEPFLQKRLRRELGDIIVDGTARNVLDKVTYYFPDALPSAPCPGQLPAGVKELQVLAPEAPSVLIACSRTVCTLCQQPTQLREPRDCCAVNIPSAFRGAPEKTEQPFALYSFAAGILRATFQEAYCSHCKNLILGGWLYDEPQGHFGKATRPQRIGSAHDRYSVLPRQQSLFAVEFDLRGFLTDELNFAATKFTAAVNVCMQRHPEALQRRLLAGEYLTNVCNKTTKLEDAWLVWQATSLALGLDASVVWDFTREGIGECLVLYASLLRKASSMCNLTLGTLLAALDAHSGSSSFSTARWAHGDAFAPTWMVSGQCLSWGSWCLLGAFVTLLRIASTATYARSMPCALRFRRPKYTP